MTGFINSGNNPISRLTIAYMEDIGYQVDYSNANNFALPSPLHLAELGVGVALEPHAGYGIILTPETVVLPESSLVD